MANETIVSLRDALSQFEYARDIRAKISQNSTRPLLVRKTRSTMSCNVNRL